MDINKYVGMPWKSGARGPDEFDCWGLLLYVFKHEYGVEINEEYYIHGKDTIRVSKAYEKAISGDRWHRQEKPSEGCAIALSQNKRIHHAGIYVQGGCLHAMDNTSVVWNHLDRLKTNGWNRIEFYKWQP